MQGKFDFPFRCFEGTPAPFPERVVPGAYQPQVLPVSFIETYSQTFSDRRPSMLCDFQVALLQVARFTNAPLGPPCSE